LKVGDIDPVEQLSDLGKPLGLIAHPNDIEHRHIVACQRHVANGGKACRLPAIVGLRQPFQPELELRQPPFGFGAREMPSPGLNDSGLGFRLRQAAGFLRRGIQGPLQNGLPTAGAPRPWATLLNQCYLQSRFLH
jgi:hypothetical protein